MAGEAGCLLAVTTWQGDRVNTSTLAPLPSCLVARLAAACLACHPCEFLIVSPIPGLDMADFTQWCEDSELSEETTKLLKDNGFSSVKAVKLLNGSLIHKHLTKALTLGQLLLLQKAVDGLQPAASNDEVASPSVVHPKALLEQQTVPTRIPEYLQLAIRLPQLLSKMAANTLVPAMPLMRPWKKGSMPPRFCSCWGNL